MRRAARGWWVAVAGAAMASGCSRATISTKVQADGSWTRTCRFQACSSSDLRESFMLPEGAPWRVCRREESDETVYTARRMLRPGQSVRQDLVVNRAESGVVERLLVSEATVREAGAGRWEYREVLRWHGSRPQSFVEPDPRVLRAFREALPRELASDAEERALLQRALREWWRIVVGPVNAWQEGASHPEYAERHAQERLGTVIDRLLREKFGKRLDRAARHAAVRQLVDAIWSTTRKKGAHQEDWFDQNERGMVPLMFTVRLPGRLVATNGGRDTLTGEVCWAFYAAAPALGDLVLTATSEAPTGRASSVRR